MGGSGVPFPGIISVQELPTGPEAGGRRAGPLKNTLLLSPRSKEYRILSNKK